MFEAIDTGSDPSDVPVSEVVRAGNLVWSVHVSEDPVTGDLVTGDIETQTREVLAAIDALLAQAGSDKRRILRAQIFLADIADFAGMNRAWDAWVVPGDAPSRATVEARLANPAWKVEIVVTAAA